MVTLWCLRSCINKCSSGSLIWNGLFLKSVLTMDTYTVQCHYNVVNFLPNPHKIHPIARPLGWGMGCILWVQTVIYALPQSVQWCMQYHSGPCYNSTQLYLWDVFCDWIVWFMFHICRCCAILCLLYVVPRHCRSVIVSSNKMSEFNSLWPNYTSCWHRFRSTLA